MIRAASWLCLLLLSLAYLAIQGNVDTNLNAFLPAKGTTAEQHLLQSLQEGGASHLLLLALEGGTALQRAQLSNQLAGALNQLAGINRALNGSQGLDAQTQELLFRYRYLLNNNSRFDQESLRMSLQQRLQELSATVAPLDKRLLPADPTAAFLDVLKTLQPRAQPRQKHGVWVSADGERALLVAQLDGRAMDVQTQTEIIANIQSSFLHLAASDDVRLILSGPAHFAAQASATIRAEAQLLSSLGTGMLLALLLLAYRSWRLLLLSALPLGTAIVVAVTAVTAVFGSIHGITLAFGITILGVAMDYPLHLFSHWNPRPDDSSEEKIWPTFWLAVSTTLIGYLSLGLTNFIGLAQLSLFAGTGLIAAALVTRWVLPSLMPDQPVRVPLVFIRGLSWLRPSPPLATWLSPGIAALILGLFGTLLLGQQLLWEENLEALAPIPAEARLLDRQLRLELGAAEPGQLIVVTGANAQQALERSEALQPQLQRLRQAGLLEHYESPSTYFPSLTAQQERQKSLPEPEALRSTLAEAQHDLPFREHVFSSFLDAIEASRQLPLLKPADLAETALGGRLGQQLRQADNGDWLVLISLIGVQAPRELAAEFAKLSLPGVVYLDFGQTSARLMLEFRDQALWRLAGGAATIFLVLAVALRSLPTAVAAISPIALACLSTVLVLRGSGQALSLFHLVALILVAGVGLDYSLFFRRWNRRGGDPRTLFALLLCFLSTFSVFVVLGSSKLPILTAIGQTVAIGVGCCFVFAYLFSGYALTGTGAGKGLAEAAEGSIA